MEVGLPLFFSNNWYDTAYRSAGTPRRPSSASASICNKGNLMKTIHGMVLSMAAACALTVASGCAAQAPVPVSAAVGQTGAATQEQDSKLLNPEAANAKAPDVFQVKFETTKGDFVIEVNRAWAPNGADRFYNMVQVGFFKDIAIFRAIENFMFQFGIHGDPAVSAKWGDATIKDDPSAMKSNVPGTISFAQTGRPNSRSCQMFINLGNNSFLDQSRGGGAPFVPFGKVIKGMEVVGKINTEYGENRGNVQGEFREKGNAYIKEKFPNIDFIKSVTLLPAEDK